MTNEKELTGVRYMQIQLGTQAVTGGYNTLHLCLIYLCPQHGGHALLSISGNVTPTLFAVHGVLLCRSCGVARTVGLAPLSFCETWTYLVAAGRAKDLAPCH